MKIKAFLDTNVLLDVIIGNRSSSPASVLIMEAVKKNLIETAVSTQSILDTAYSLRGQIQQGEFYRFTEWMINYINVDYINTFDIKNAIRENSGDFEDDAQVARALDTCCDVFVTSDKKLCKRYDGKYEFLQFMSPEEFVSKLKGEAIPSQT